MTTIPVQPAAYWVSDNSLPTSGIPSPECLTSIAAVLAWLPASNSTTTSAGQLTSAARLIRFASAFVLNYCNRAGFAVAEYTDTYDAPFGSNLLLRQYPVQSVSALGVLGLGQPVPAYNTANPASSGWMLEPIPAGNAPQKLSLMGCAYRFPARTPNSVTVTYRAGYAAADTAVIPAGNVPHQVATSRTWIGDNGGVVDLASGLVFDFVPGAAPALVSGQFAMPSPGVYSFAQADAGRTVGLAYSATPLDVEQVIVEMVGERLSYRSRIGERSHTVEGQTVGFYQRDMTDTLKLMLSNFKRVVPN